MQSVTLHYVQQHYWDCPACHTRHVQPLYDWVASPPPAVGETVECRSCQTLSRVEAESLG
jgi:hypothetical protein